MNDSPTSIFDAARKGDVKTVHACLEAGADPAASNEYGFTALHCAAMGSNSADVDRIVEVLKLLLEANSPLESLDGVGRTPLFLAAEFSRSVVPVQLLLDAGANPHATNNHGNTIVKNAMARAVKALLSEVTGIPVPEPPPPAPAPVKLTAKEWREVKEQIDAVYEKLSVCGLVALHDAGDSQEDGFSDCSEEFRIRGEQDAGVHGFCYYTRQDLNRAKRTGQLSLAFWGAPEGAAPDMKRVGELIVRTFREAGFSITWNGDASQRPTVFLKKP